jgi:apolipoprotein D and lipocalin family protein
MTELYIKQIIILVMITALSFGSCRSEKPENMDMSTIEELDLNRYMGTWYEIARFDHSFERGLEGVSATYSLRPDGKITVINQGYKNSTDGKLKVAKGKARQPDPDDPGKLEVAFFLFFYADYYILELEQNYRWALIGSSSDKYLWILSRTPLLEKETISEILEKAARRGYDTNKLIWVKQNL